MSSVDRDVREIVRDEPLMRAPILDALASHSMTVPELATAIDRPTHEVVYWVMGLRRYGYVREEKEIDDDGYFRYQPVQGSGS